MYYIYNKYLIVIKYYF